MTSSAANRYLEDRVLTATPAELIGMLYDVAFRSLTTAQACLRVDDRLGAGRLLVKAQDAVVELRCGLDKECADGEAAALAGRLDSLYGYVYLRLVRANVHGDAAALAECLGIVQSLRDAWRESCLRIPAPVVP